RINTQGGSVFSVSRRPSDFDVRVDKGNVSVVWPDGKKQELGATERTEAVPLQIKVSSTPTDVAPRRNPSVPVRRPSKHQTAVKGVAGPEWLVRYNALDDDGALALLRKQGDISAIIESSKGAGELQAIADLMRHKGKDQGAAIRALTRIVESFPGDP